MSKKDLFEKNKNRLVKKAVIYIIVMILIVAAFVPIVSSCHPGIKITKTGPIFGYVGDEITYNYNVSNTGDVPLSNVNITDDKCGPVNYVSGDENDNGKLDTNEIWTFTCTYTPSFTFPDPLVNTATASSVWKKKTVNASDDYTLYPFILRKDVLLYWEGENIDYNDPDTQFTINMSKDGEVLDTFTISESSIKRLWLSEGTYQFCEIDLPDGYESAYGCISHTTGQDYPDFTHLNVITFDLAIEKSGPEYCFPGNNITYYYQVTNDGPASVTPIVEDDICGTTIYTGGDSDGDGLIDPNETWTYESNYTVVEEPGSFINNTANVTDAEGAGRPPDQWWLGGDRNLSNNIDDWSAEVICPDPEDEYTLTINYEGNGTVTKNPDQPTYTYGTLVELTAIADSGWTFDHWDGDLSGSENPENITMDGNKTVIANFTKDEEQNGDDGSDPCPPDMVSYWKFDETSGSIASDSYDGNHGTVYGAIWTSAGQVNNALRFDGDDYVEVPDDESLHLSNFTVMAWANASQFGEWRTVLAKDKTGQSEFWFGYNPNDKLDFKFNGQGGVNINANTVIDEVGWHFLVGVYNGTHLMVYVDGYLDNTPMVYPNMNEGNGTLKMGYTQNWCCCYFTGDLDEVAVIDRALSASEILSLYNKSLAGNGYCWEDQYTLTINIVGDGSVAKNPDQSTYTYGTLVELTATADPGWTFDHWSGDLSGSSNPATISMTGDKTVTATFTEDQYTLTININGSGTVSKDPDQETYTYGTLVNLTATADPGWTFDHWDGDLSSSENPENITMDDNKTVIANFTEIEDECEDEEEDEEEDDDNPVVVTSKSSGRSYSTNLLPVANANGPYDGVIDKEIEFDGSKSYDPDGTITNYSWSFGDGTTGFGERVTHKYSYGRYFVVELTVLDNSGARDTNKTAVFLSVPNNPPSIPMISGPNGSKDTKYSYAFGSTDPDNDDINYIINWGDGTTNESGFLPSGHYFSMLHSWAKSGEYNITVTASDNQSTSSSEMTVLIEENIVMDNIAIVVLGILALIVLLISLLYIKKGKK